MKSITSADKGKRYFLDGNRNSEVTLFDVMPDDFAKVVFPDGRHASVAVGRLTEITEISEILGLQRVEDDVKELLEYPQKAVKVTIEIFDAEKGETIIKYLEDEDAVQWNDWMRELCFKAEQVGMNPPWMTLKWKTKGA